MCLFVMWRVWCQAKKCSLGAEATQDLLICFLWVLKNIDERFLKCWWTDMTATRLSQVLEVLCLCESHFEYKVWAVVVNSMVGAEWLLCSCCELVAVTVWHQQNSLFFFRFLFILARSKPPSTPLFFILFFKLHIIVIYPVQHYIISSTLFCFQMLYH